MKIVAVSNVSTVTKVKPLKNMVVPINRAGNKRQEVRFFLMSLDISATTNFQFCSHLRKFILMSADNILFPRYGF